MKLTSQTTLTMTSTVSHFDNKLQYNEFTISKHPAVPPLSSSSLGCSVVLSLLSLRTFSSSKNKEITPIIDKHDMKSHSQNLSFTQLFSEKTMVLDHINKTPPLDTIPHLYTFYLHNITPPIRNSIHCLNSAPPMAKTCGKEYYVHTEPEPKLIMTQNNLHN